MLNSLGTSLLFLVFLSKSTLLRKWIFLLPPLDSWKSMSLLLTNDLGLQLYHFVVVSPIQVILFCDVVLPQDILLDYQQLGWRSQAHDVH